MKTVASLLCILSLQMITYEATAAQRGKPPVVPSPPGLPVWRPMYPPNSSCPCLTIVLPEKPQCIRVLVPVKK